MGDKTQSILNEADIKEIERYSTSVKNQLISNLKQGKTDKLQIAIEGKLKEEMLVCAKEFFEKEVRDDLLKAFSSQKEVMIEMGTAAIIAISKSLADGLSKQIATKMESSWNTQKIVKVLFE